MICTPKVIHFWGAYFLCQIKIKNKKDIVRNLKSVSHKGNYWNGAMESFFGVLKVELF